MQKIFMRVPAAKKYTASKLYYDLLYGALLEMSYLDGDERYVDKKNVVFTKLGKKIGLSRQTTAVKFDNLIKLGLIEYHGIKRRYKLNDLDEDESFLISFENLKMLNEIGEHNYISLYVYFLKRYLEERECEYLVTMREMKNFIGISAEVDCNNDDDIKKIMLKLRDVGLVEWEDRFFMYVTEVKV